MESIPLWRWYRKAGGVSNRGKVENSDAGIGYGRHRFHWKPSRRAFAPFGDRTGRRFPLGDLTYGAERIADRIKLRRLELTEPNVLLPSLEEFQPQVIYHLAGQASVPASFNDKRGTHRANVDATRCLFETVAEFDRTIPILFVSTGQVHGQPLPGELPIRENSPIRPNNPYAESKAAADQLALDFVSKRGVHIVIARLFNNLGPRQETEFAIPRFAKQIAEFEFQYELDPNSISLPAKLTTGRLDIERDFSDVRDVVRSFPMLIKAAKPGEIFNVATGKTSRLDELLNQLKALAKIPIENELDPSLVRPTDQNLVKVSIDKLQSVTNWKATIPIQKTLQDTLDYWRSRVRHERLASNPTKRKSKVM